MREIVARLTSVLTVVMVLALAHLFAVRHNPAPAALAAPPVATPVAPAAAPAPAADPGIAHGRQVYADQRCASCHAIGGSGNPRNPLDGVGARLSRAELLDWVTGTGTATDQLAPAVARRKARYRDLPVNDMNALIAYLASLTANG